MSFRLGTNSRKNLEGVDPELIKLIENALKRTKIDFGIPSLGGLRTAEEQKKLFLAGKSTLDGTEKLSRHQSGQAFDIFAYVDGRASWNKRHLMQCAVAILETASQMGIALEYGGNWSSFPDYPHFERA